MSTTMDRINNQETKETSKVPTVEVFTDSDWGGSSKDRSSTSSGMVFVCGSLVSSWSSRAGCSHDWSCRRNINP